METRAPAVAGSFYPADPDSLREQIEAYLAAAKPTAIIPKALIGPHAGTIYSGAIAASAYIAVRALKEQIKRQLLAPVDKSMPHKMGLTSPGMVECGPCGRQHHAGHPECLANSTVAEAPEFKFQRGPTFYCQSEED